MKINLKKKTSALCIACFFACFLLFAHSVHRGTRKHLAAVSYAASPAMESWCSVSHAWQVELVLCFAIASSLSSGPGIVVPWTNTHQLTNSLSSSAKVKMTHWLQPVFVLSGWIKQPSRVGCLTCTICLDYSALSEMMMIVCLPGALQCHLDVKGPRPKEITV